MIIFGWGHTTRKKFGPVAQNVCNNCDKEEFWVLEKVMVWFTLFFIPIFPYKITYFLYCPVCQYGAELKQEQISKFKPIAELNNQLVVGKITRQEYDQKMRITSGEDQEIENDQKQSPVRNNSDTISKDKKFCGNCGLKIKKEDVFCSGCGNKV